MSSTADSAPNSTAPTIADVVALPSMTDALVQHLNASRTGESLGQQVRWMHVVESNDSVELLDGGEFVLTTATMLDVVETDKGLYDRAQRFLNQVEQAGAVALAYEVLADRPQVAEALQQAAQRSDIPVFAFAQRARFVAVTQEVHRRIATHQLDQLERDRHIHEVFTTLSLQSAGAEHVLREASTLIGARVHWRRGDDGSSRSEQTGVQVIAAGEAAGWLTVEGSAPEPEPTAQVLERAAQALAVTVLVERSQREMLRQAESALLHELRRPRAIEETVARQRMHDLLSSSPVEHQTTALNAAAWVPLAVKLTPTHSHEDALTLQRHSGRLLDSFTTACHHARKAGLIARLDASTIGALLPLPAAALEGHVLEQILSRAVPQNQQDGFAVGVGTVTDSLTTAALELTEAQRIAEAALALQKKTTAPHKSRYYRARDVRLRGLLASLQDDPRWNAFMRSELGALLQSESTIRRHTEQLQLLEHFLNVNGNKTELARQMHLSRPALYDRLERLESKLGLPLNDAESRTSLHVALLLFRLSE